MTDPGRKRLVRYYDGQRPASGRHHPPGRRAGRRTPIDPGQPARRRPVPFAERQDLSFLRAVWDASRCEDLLQPVMLDGERVRTAPSLDEIRARAQGTGGVTAGRGPPAAQPRDLRGRPVPRLASEKVRMVRPGPGRAGAGEPGRRRRASLPEAAERSSRRLLRAVAEALLSAAAARPRGWPSPVPWR